MKLQAIRGMRDLYGEEMAQWQSVERSVREVLSRFGYQEFRTPVLEKVEVFTQTVGEDSDIVEKQMYVFKDQNEETLALRPECTAAFVRAVIEHQLHKVGRPLRFYYYLPMFRYERPQKGRLRQFHQFGAELINDSSPEADAESIVLLDAIYRQLGISEYVVKINNIGTEASRGKYRDALKDFFKDKLSELCPQCQKRFERAPMRILDCKNEACQEVAKDAPVILDYLDPESRAHHERVQHCLKMAGLSFEVDPRIVRGLDYYSQTAFEFQSDLLGAQSALGAGGRYDGLAIRFSEKPIPAVGWALGMERLMIALEAKAALPKSEGKPQYFFAPLGPEAFDVLYGLSLKLKRAGVWAELIYEKDKSLKAQLKQANKSQAPFAVVLGEEEIKKGQAVLRDMGSSSQENIPLNELEAHLLRRTQRAT